MKHIKAVAGYFGILLMFASFIILAHAMFCAQGEEKVWIMRFNHFGEWGFETALFLLGVPCAFYAFYHFAANYPLHDDGELRSYKYNLAPECQKCKVANWWGR